MRLAVLFLALAACKPAPIGPRGDCDPLQPDLCALPFPSDFFLKDDASTATGRRVDFALNSLPGTRDDVPLDPTDWNRFDGFSIDTPILAWFGDVSLDGVIPHDDIAAYADADAMTVIVDTTTGERVPHFVELDVTPESPRERLLMLRPARPLDWNHTYVVGLRHFVHTDGSAVTASPAFAALRDGKRTDDPDTERQRDEFDPVIFPALEQAGFPRDDLQLAWDFTTESRDSALGRMDAIRDDLVTGWGSDGPTFTIDDVQTGSCDSGHIGLTLQGHVDVPLFTEEDAPDTHLTRDENGLPYENGTTRVPFLVRVPCSVLADPKPTPVLQYGHGLLGSRDEANTGWLSDFADHYGYIIVATDWTGMSETDIGSINVMLATDISDFAILPERCHQGFANQMALTRLVKTGLGTDANLMKAPTGGGDPVSLIDPSQVYFYGNSQGGIMGGALLAMSPDLQRGVLGVSGLPYSLLLPRSHDFTPFHVIFDNKYDDGRDFPLIVAVMQLQWDPAEGGGWTHDMVDPPAGIPAKQVLMQNGIGDAQVTTIGGQYQARAYGAVSVAPENRPIFGVDETEGPIDGNAIVEWKFSDVPPEPDTDVPADDAHDVHECVRREPEGQAQVDEFLKTGVVDNPCDGACVGVQEGCR